MTKREFNTTNKRNYGQRMASDTREDYREIMLRDNSGRDKLAERAAYRHEVVVVYASYGFPYRPLTGALTLGSKYRAGLRWQYGRD